MRLRSARSQVRFLPGASRSEARSANPRRCVRQVCQRCRRSTFGAVLGISPPRSTRSSERLEVASGDQTAPANGPDQVCARVAFVAFITSASSSESQHRDSCSPSVSPSVGAGRQRPSPTCVDLKDGHRATRAHPFLSTVRRSRAAAKEMDSSRRCNSGGTLIVLPSRHNEEKGAQMSLWLVILIVLVVLAVGGFRYSRR